ncbi:MAG TPA: GNAT family N-acetyltransferase [Nitrososphaeraceae archaeon]
MSQGINIRPFQENDFDNVKEFISDVIVNEFKFKLEFDTLDSDILAIGRVYNKLNRGCMWIAETFVDDFNPYLQLQKIVGTTAVRNLDEFEYTCELKRMYVSINFRRLGLGQKLLDKALDFAINCGYSRMVLDSSRTLYAARSLYLKNGFVDVPRYNNNYRADVFMEKKISSS